MAHVTSADSSSPERDARPRPRLLYVVTEDWAFLLHRLPMARAARAAGFDVHVATNVTDGAAAIEREGFVLHPVRFARGRISPASSIISNRSVRLGERVLARDRFGCPGRPSA